MKVAVFDTSVSREDGRRMTFDIVVRDTLEQRDPVNVLGFGRRYLSAKGIAADTLQSSECKFCHAGFAPPETAAEIERVGFAIIELQNCAD